MERDALAARDPLLARRTMRVLGVEIAHEHGFLAAGAVAHAEDARVAVGRGRRVIEHMPAVGAFGITDVVAVNGVPRRHVRDGVDLDALAPGLERVVLGGRGLGGRWGDVDRQEERERENDRFGDRCEPSFVYPLGLVVACIFLGAEFLVA